MIIVNLIDRACPLYFRPYYERIKTSSLGFRMAQGAFWSVLGAAVSRGLSTIGFVLVARALGKEVFGEFGMIRNTVGMFGILAGFGLGLTGTKYVAEFRLREPLRAGRILALTEVIVIGTAGLIGASVFLLAPWLASETLNAPHLTGALRAGCVLLLLNAMDGVQTGGLAGFEDFKSIANISIVSSFISSLFIFIGARTIGLSGAIWGSIISMLLQNILSYFALRKIFLKSGLKLLWLDCFKEYRVLWNFSIPSVISSAMVSPATWLARAMLVNQPGGYSELGLFEAADKWRSLVLFAPSLIARSTLPILSQLYGERRRRDFRRVLLVQFAVGGMSSLFLASLIAILAKPIMSAYGEGFMDGVNILRVTMFTALLMELTQIAGLVNKSIGHLWWGAFFNGLWAIAFLMLNQRLIGSGAFGLAKASLLSYCIYFLLTMIYITFVFKYSPKLRTESLP